MAGTVTTRPTRSFWQLCCHPCSPLRDAASVLSKVIRSTDLSLKSRRGSPCPVLTSPRSQGVAGDPGWPPRLLNSSRLLGGGRKASGHHCSPENGAGGGQFYPHQTPAVLIRASPQLSAKAAGPGLDPNRWWAACRLLHRCYPARRS